MYKKKGVAWQNFREINFCDKAKKHKIRQKLGDVKTSWYTVVHMQMI